MPQKDHQEVKSRSERQDECIKWVNFYQKKIDALSQKKDNEEHILSDLLNYGRFARTGTYRRNGYFHIMNIPQLADHQKDKEKKRDQYDVNDAILFKRLKLAVNSNKPNPMGYKWDYEHKLSQGIRHNFLAGYLPYDNEAHHLLPVDSFDKFSDEHMKILRKVPYSVNRGSNIIFLPQNKEKCIIHILPSHSGGHDKYNKIVFSEFKGLKSILTRIINKNKEKCKASKIDLEKVLKRLSDYEKDFWEWHITKGKKLTLNTESGKIEGKSVSDHAIEDYNKTQKRNLSAK